MSLKQQLQKTGEEFEKMKPEVPLVASDDEKIRKITQQLLDRLWDSSLKQIKQFIRQSQIDAVKTFAEEVNIKLGGMQFVDPAEAQEFALHAFGYNQGLEEAIDEMNNLLKDIWTDTTK